MEKMICKTWDSQLGSDFCLDGSLILAIWGEDNIISSQPALSEKQRVGKRGRRCRESHNGERLKESREAVEKIR
jgi:hypothetical protein